MTQETPPHRPAVTRVSLTQARANLGALIERLHTSNERIIIEENDEAVAVLMGIDEFEDYLELHDPEVNAVIAESREEHLAGKSRPAEELLRELEEDEERERRGEKASAPSDRPEDIHWGRTHTPKR